jgi:hypothetical protein
MVLLHLHDTSMGPFGMVSRGFSFFAAVVKGTGADEVKNSGSSAPSSFLLGERKRAPEPEPEVKNSDFIGS